MIFFFIFPVVIVIIAGMFFCASQIAVRSVYKELLSDDFLDKLLPTLLKKAHCHHGDILSNHGDRPYISRHGGDVFSRWHISDVGRIPRKSKWHKIVNDRWLELLLK